MEYKYEIVPADELCHHGTKGMRWGVRRFQNKDGSLTAAGKKRRAKLEGELDKLGGSKKTETDKTASSARKRAGDMTDDELDKAIVRARKEDEYNRLRPEPVAAPKKSSVLINEVLKPAMMNSGRKMVETAMNKLTDKLLGDKVDPNSVEALKKTFEKLELTQKIDKIRDPDKYLSEEDKTKRADREYKAEDRAAQKEGYANAADKATKERAAKEASRKAEADEAARAANEPKSKEYYNSGYNNKGAGERTTVNDNEPRGLSLMNSSVSNLSKTSTSSGKTYSDNYMNDSYTELIDRSGNVIWRSGGERK